MCHTRTAALEAEAEAEAAAEAAAKAAAEAASRVQRPGSSADRTTPAAGGGGQGTRGQQQEEKGSSGGGQGTVTEVTHGEEEHRPGACPVCPGTWASLAVGAGTGRGTEAGAEAETRGTGTGTGATPAPTTWDRDRDLDLGPVVRRRRTFACLACLACTQFNSLCRMLRTHADSACGIELGGWPVTCDPPATGSPEGLGIRVPSSQEEWLEWAEMIQDKVEYLMEVLEARDQGAEA